MRKADYPIDAVIAWVDGSDPAWRAERAKYAPQAEAQPVDDNEARYRDGGTLRYVLRGIDRYMPWVRTVHLITWGHLPPWLNEQAEGLRIVNHRDYIPAEYLPTFSSHTIELNMHRIPGLAEHFIYFNDDMLPLKPLRERDFFIDGLPADFAAETALNGRYLHSIAGVLLSNAEIINQHFSKRAVLRAHPFKWLNFRYGVNLLKTCLLLPWPRFSDFGNNHTVSPFLKKTFEQVWKKEFGTLDAVCRHRFRVMSDVNQWLMRDWQLVTGSFMPKRANTARPFNVTNDLSPIAQALRQKRYKTLCLNDVSYEKLDDVDHTLAELDALLQEAFPQQSRFERANG